MWYARSAGSLGDSKGGNTGSVASRSHGGDGDEDRERPEGLAADARMKLETALVYCGSPSSAVGGKVSALVAAVTAAAKVDMAIKFSGWLAKSSKLLSWW